MSDPIQDVRSGIADVKSSVLSLATTVEYLIEIVMADYFTKDHADFQFFCSLFYPNDIELTFGKKTKNVRKISYNNISRIP